MRAITIYDHFAAPKDRQEQVLNWLRSHGLDPGVVFEIVERRPGLFRVQCFAEPLTVRDGVIERITREIVSEYPPPGLVPLDVEDELQVADGTEERVPLTADESPEQ